MEASSPQGLQGCPEGGACGWLLGPQPSPVTFQSMAAPAASSLLSAGAPLCALPSEASLSSGTFQAEGRDIISSVEAVPGSQRRLTDTHP